MKFFYVILLILVLIPNFVFAVQPSEMLADPQMESRARDISKDLRCLVCQNQSIDDSDADLAHDLRVLVRQLLQAGYSDRQVKQFLVDRYGDFILLNPPFKASTFILWFGPLFLLVIGILCPWITYSRHIKKAGSSKTLLSSQERQRVACLMSQFEPTKRKNKL